ncbi:MAG TPA: DUF6559 family protein [Rhizomicrobium sp.]
MFGRWLLHRAARKYAGKLPHQLFVDYGHEEFYSEAQIHRAVADAHLNPRYIVLAFARYLPREHFEKLAPALPVKLDYYAARELFIADEPIVLQSRTGTPGRMYRISDRNTEL